MKTLPDGKIELLVNGQSVYLQPTGIDEGPKKLWHAEFAINAPGASTCARMPVLLYGTFARAFVSALGAWLRYKNLAGSMADKNTFLGLTLVTHDLGPVSPLAKKLVLEMACFLLPGETADMSDSRTGGE